MKSFLQFLDEKHKTVKFYGYGTSQSPSKLFSVVRPAKPAKPVSPMKQASFLKII